MLDGQSRQQVTCLPPAYLAGHLATVLAAHTHCASPATSPAICRLRAVTKRKARKALVTLKSLHGPWSSATRGSAAGLAAGSAVGSATDTTCRFAASSRPRPCPRVSMPRIEGMNTRATTTDHGPWLGRFWCSDGQS
ncbi:hypothetical protein CDD82_5817 [Ophiocordyceps australis]|uniref:Uncharacterized protein n=1 Tax=Ophiocordyceps australis TaxID=1399860 RepID=A0A2C5ZT01_9HYPO|nr:hypothetical protein CDD82_5817 [Ophiocordyceps australis]